MESTPDIAKRRIQAFHIELVLERHRYTVERADELAILLPEFVKSSRLADGIVEAYFSQAICLAHNQIETKSYREFTNLAVRFTGTFSV